MTWKRPAGVSIIPARDIPPGPRGLGGYCWTVHPGTGVHCCMPANRPHGQHWHPYSKASW